MTSPSLYGKGPANPNVMFSKGSIIPSSNEHFNLGSPAARWKELYLSGQTIHLGDSYIKEWSESNGISVEALHASNLYTDRILMSDTIDSQISPSFSWKNDSNSGMFHANSDQIGFTTGGVERLRISATGPIGIGTTNPQAPLHVDGTIKANAFIGDGSLLSGIGGSSKWTHTNDGVDIYVAGKSVGIGTNLPDEALDVRGTVKAEAFVGDGSQLVGIVASKWTNAGSDLFVSGSNVGIGTTAPQQALDVVGAVQATSFVGNGSLLTGIISSKWSNTGSNMFVMGSNVGINTSTPDHALHVVGNARIEGNLTVNGTQTVMNTNVGTTEQMIITNDGTGPALVVNQTGEQPILEFQDDGVPVLKIINGGNVGIGTTEPLQKLQVQGNILASGTVTGTSFVGNAATATTLQTARTINGTAFNGSANITISSGPGSILQMVIAKINTDTFLTSTSFVPTVVSGSITPKFSTSLIIVQMYAMVNFGNVSGESGVIYQIRRDGVQDTNTVAQQNYQAMTWVKQTATNATINTNVIDKLCTTTSYTATSTSSTTFTLWARWLGSGMTASVGNGLNYGRSEVIITEVAV